MSLITTEPRSALVNDIDNWALRVLKELEQADIDYCVLRGGHQLSFPADDNEIDLLIRPQQLHSLQGLLADLGFVALHSWGHSPHYFFVAYDSRADQWLKLDVVVQVAYGRPTHALVTPLADSCLKNRCRCGSVFIPSIEDELVTLLLHCVVDKGAFPWKWQRRLVTLVEHIGNEAYVNELLGKYWAADFTASDLCILVQKQRWDELIAYRPAVKKRLAAASPVSTIVRTIRDHSLRKLSRLAKIARPQAISVALLAPDGAGKSTLAAGLTDHFFFPVKQIYMGLYQTKQTTANSRRVPGFGLLGKLFTQWRRYFQAQLHKSHGRFVIFDRYTYDALLPARSKQSRWHRARRWLLAHACPAPDLIVVLDAPGAILFSRKGEHSPETLEQDRQGYLSLQQRFPNLIVVNANQDAVRIRNDVVSLMWRAFAQRGRDN